MIKFPISENIEEALKLSVQSRSDELGYSYHTFRVRLDNNETDWKIMLSTLVDSGWQLQGTPTVMEAKGELPLHILISMLHVEPRPLVIRGELRIRGDFSGGGELRSEPRR